MRLAPSSSIAFELDVLLLERLLEALQLGDIAGRGKDALEDAVTVVERGRVVRDHGELAVPGPRGELEVPHRAFVQHAVDPCFGPVGISEVVLERSADQLVTRAPGQGFRLLVHIGDDAAGIGRHQRVDIGLDQRAGVEVLIADPLIQLLPFFFDLLAGGIVGANQQVADDRLLCIPKRRDRHHGREARPVLADVSS